MWRLLLLAAFTAHAQRVLIPAPGAGAREYAARLQTSADLVSPTDAYLKQHPLPASRERLLQRFADAQKAYLENSLPEARERFTEVVELVLSDDWNKSDREVLLHAYLRLAQIDGTQSEHWLLQALMLGPGLELDRNLFPPPLLKQLAELRTRSASAPVRRLLGDWPRLLINGVSCTAAQCPEFPLSAFPARVTFLSDTFVPVTVRVPLSALSGLKIERTALVQGRCGSPSFHARAGEFAAKDAFFGLACESQNQLQLQPQPRVPNALDMTLSAGPTRAPFYHSKWFWIGLGVVTTAIASSQMLESN